MINSIKAKINLKVDETLWKKFIVYTPREVTLNTQLNKLIKQFVDQCSKGEKSHTSPCIKPTILTPLEQPYLKEVKTK